MVISIALRTLLRRNLPWSRLQNPCRFNLRNRVPWVRGSRSGARIAAGIASRGPSLPVRSVDEGAQIRADNWEGFQTRWGINEKTVKSGVIPVIRKVARDESLTVIDLYQALSGKPAMFPDKIHPNAAGAKLMAQTIHSVLKKKH